MDSPANWDSGLSDLMSSSYLWAQDCTSTGGFRGGLSNTDTRQSGLPILLVEARPFNL